MTGGRQNAKDLESLAYWISVSIWCKLTLENETG
jgi:hypothetical protein